MKNEKILTVIKGQEFKLSLKDKIEINDIFYDQYLEAAAMLENIMANEKAINSRIGRKRKRRMILSLSVENVARVKGAQCLLLLMQ